MPASDIKSIMLLVFATALGTVPSAHADDTPLEAFARQIGVTVARAAQAHDDRLAGAVGEPSVLDAFVKQVGFDITSVPPELQAEWVNSSRAASMPHELFCPIHGGDGAVHAGNSSTTVGHAHVHAHSLAGTKME